MKKELENEIQGGVEDLRRSLIRKTEALQVDKIIETAGMKSSSIFKRGMKAI